MFYDRLLVAVLSSFFSFDLNLKAPTGGNNPEGSVCV